MVGTQGSPDNQDAPQQQHFDAAGADVWTQLGALASCDGSDPILQLLVSEAIARYEELRGVTATIASRYRALVDAVPDAVIIHDESGNVVDANEAACQLYRQERESLLRSSMLELNPGLETEFLASLHEVQEHAPSLTATSSIVSEDGTTSDLELHARAYLDSGRVRIIAVVRDLGQRELAFQQLRESESWQRNLLREVDKGIIVFGQHGQVLSANRAACRTLQMSESDLRALAPDQWELWQYFDASGHSIDRSALPWVRAFQTGEPHESAIHGINLPGMTSTLWLSASAVPHFDGNRNEPDKVVCIFAEVTPIQRDAMMFAQLQSLNNIGAWQLDLDRDGLLCSSQMRAILDVPASTPISRPRMLEHFAGGDLERFRKAVDNAREGNQDEFEALMTTSIGRKRRVRIRVRPLFDGSRVHALFGTLKDITRDSPDTPLAV